MQKGFSIRIGKVTNYQTTVGPEMRGFSERRLFFCERPRNMEKRA